MYKYFSIIGILLLLSACEMRPSQKSLHQKIKGRYCSGNYTLILEDSTYTNIKVVKGELTQTPFRESCTGKYKITLKEGHWVIEFARDFHSNAVKDCRQEYTLWTEKEGYLVGDDEVTMRDLFDNTPLKKGNCD